MAPARFEYATISWSSVDALTSPDLWTQWALNAEFRALPPTQEMRHRCVDKVMYLGDTLYKYDLQTHPNMEHQPNWHV